MFGKLFGMLVLGMLIAVPTSAAFGADAAGYANVDAGAYANVDVSGALRVVEETKARVNETIGTVTDMQARVRAHIASSANATQRASFEARDETRAHGETYSNWSREVRARPHVEADHEVSGESLTSILAEVTTLDGALEMNAREHTATHATLEYDLPPPPKPQVGFLASLKLVLEGALRFG